MTELEKTLRRKEIHMRLYVIVVSFLLYASLYILYLVWELREAIITSSTLQTEWRELIE